ncbi:Exopolyphosphatase [gamma proteobacterium IMCC2047]|nr:Exopolyphosphatase [gamma proteobacterium IMCC2047]
MPGFTQQQQQLLACLIRFHRKKIRPAELPKLSIISPQKLCYLITIMRLAILLNQKRQPNYLPDYQLQATTESLHLDFPDTWLEEQALLKADLDVEQQYLDKIGISLRYNNHLT